MPIPTEVFMKRYERDNTIMLIIAVIGMTAIITLRLVFGRDESYIKPALDSIKTFFLK